MIIDDDTDFPDNDNDNYSSNEVGSRTMGSIVDETMNESEFFDANEGRASHRVRFQRDTMEESQLLHSRR